MRLQTKGPAGGRRGPGYRWYALGVTTFSQGTVAALTFAVGPLAPFLLHDFQVSRAELGLTTSAIYLSSTAVAMFGGRAADRTGERRMLMISGAVAAVAAFLAPRPLTFWAFLGVCLVLGIGNGLQNPAGSAAVMRWFARRQRGFAMGIRQTGVPLGSILAAALYPSLALRFGWRSAYLVGGGLMLLAVLTILLTYYDPAPPGGSGQAPPQRFRELLRDRSLVGLGIVFLTQMTAQQAAATYLVLYLTETFRMPVAAAAGLLAGVNLIATGARVGWGLLSDVGFGGRRKPIISIILTITLLGTLMAAAMPRGASLGLAVLLAVILGLSAFAWTGVTGAMVVESAGQRSPGSAMALAMTLSGPGSLFGPPLFGFLTDRTGSYRPAWLALSIVVVAGIWTLSRVREHSMAVD